MIRVVILALIIFLSPLLRAQDTVNLTDSKGKRQGFWRKSDTAGRTVYEGRFRDGLPEGEFRYYYPDGKLKTVSMVSRQGTRAETVSYFPNGKKMACGNYLNEKKDSTWRFYSETTDALVSEDNYAAGNLHGLSKIYYPDGGVSELQYYNKGLKEGLWEQYFLDGKLKLRGAYKAGEKAGIHTVYFINGKPMITGQYADGHQDGTWVYYDEKGVVILKETYRKGALLKSEPAGK